MADNNIIDGFGEGLHKVFLAGVGALATTSEKGKEIIDNLVKKGELTVEQGKQLNSELAHKAQAAKSEAKDAAQNAAQNMANAAEGLKQTVKANAEEAKNRVNDAVEEAQKSDSE